jgi:ABC-type antimicrobial peptide transport system permease subunit
VRVAVFYLSYLRNELVRRRARTILTALGLALGVALVIVIAALTRGLDQAQATALDPLASIGTDLTVTRAAEEGGGPFGRGGAGDLLAANRSVITDLSKLGKPGEKFVHDFFLPGTQLTFAQADAQRIASIDGVADVAAGLTLMAQHQEGVVPKIVAKIQTGGQTFDIRRRIEPPTQAELEKIQACIQEKQGESGEETPAPVPQTEVAPPPAGGDPGERPRGMFFGVGGGAFQECMPPRFRRIAEQFTTPRETLQQVLDPPQTNIKSEPYTIGGVDQTKPALALVTPAQVSAGRYLAPKGGREALLSSTYAAGKKLKVGSKLNLNGKKFAVVGLVEPPLGGQTADVYLPLAQLQALAGLKGAANVALVRAEPGSSVADVQASIEGAVDGAQVASAKEVSEQINGSLVDASNLSSSLGLALSLVAAAAAFLLAALLTLSSVGKRVRELGTLKALGWTQRLVVRQVVGESLAQSLLGGVAGIVLGVAAAKVIGGYGPTLEASSSAGTGSLFGLGEVTRTVSREVSLSAPVGGGVLALGLGLALAGGLIAGAAGALRAARLRPADALRRVE